MKIYQATKKISKQKIDSYGGYDVYLVNEEDIRNTNLADEEFTNYAIHEQFPKMIPKNEIWIGEEVAEHERKIFINTAVKLYNLMNNGMDMSEAYDIALKHEKAFREKVDGIKNRGTTAEDNPPEEIYMEKYGTIGGDITVWIINGEIARDLYKTDFVEGGHGYVYHWIPKNEIWIENDLHEDEVPFVLCHEYTELKLMRDKNMDYEKAHEISAKKEFEKRNKRKELKDL